MSNSIEVIWRDGTRWNIHRSAIKAATRIPRGWFSDWEWDMLNTLIKMDKEGIAIDSLIHADPRRL